MTEFVDFFRKLFYYGDWPPITECGKWTNLEIYTMLSGFALATVACFTLMMYAVIRGKYLVKNYSTVVFSLGLLLLASMGTVCVANILAFWRPVYRLNAFATAVAGVTAFTQVLVVMARGGLSKASKYKEMYDKEIAGKEQLSNALTDTLEGLEQQLSFTTLRADRFETIMASSQHPALITDNKLRLIYANGAAQALLPDSFAEMTGNSNWLTMLLQEDVALMQEQSAILTINSAYSVFPIRLMGKSAHTVHMECIIQLMRLPGMDDPCLMIEFTEVTDYVVRISELVALQQKADKRLQEALNYADAASKEIDTFSYAVSHDLKAPLRVISGYAEMCYNDIKKTDNAETTKALEIIVANTRQFGGMLDSLTSLTRITRKDLVAVQADMDSIVRSVVEEFKKLPGNGAEITIGHLPPAVCDSVLLRQVWYHLIDNAFKFSSKEASPQIRIGAEEQGDKIVYYIADNGVGFDMQYADKLFGLFQRLHKKTDYAGSGLGLATVQRIMLKHGGYIWADGKENVGATFYFTLPKST